MLMKEETMNWKRTRSLWEDLEGGERGGIYIIIL